MESLKWEYHNEGNANMIFKDFDHKVTLRLRKVSGNQIDQFSSKKHSNSYSLEQEQKYKREILFCLCENTEYFHESKLVWLPQQFIEKNLTNSKIELQRPEYRRSKYIDTKPQFGLTMPFLGLFKCPEKLPSANFINVELKPKWGSLPLSKHVNPIKQVKCRFCLLQNLKTAKSLNGTTSKYCPLDLFGNCKCEVSHAMSSLLETPLNNLKLTVNGSFIETDSVTLNTTLSKQSLCEILTEIIHTDSKQGENDNNENQLGDERSLQTCSNSKFLQHQFHCIKQGDRGVLNLLRRLQQLDKYDIECIYGTYMDVLKESGFTTDDFLDFDSTLWTEFKTQVCTGRIPQQEFNVFDICQFLVAATFKDCSIMITFCEIERTFPSTSKHIIKSNNGKHYMYQIKLIDLDPRSILNMSYYYSLDQNILSANI